MRPLFLSFCLLTLPALAQTTTPSPSAMGHIVGRVVNQAGEPVPRAIICWGHSDDHSSGSTCGVPADEDGRFDVTVPLETNHVAAQKLSEGYWADDEVNKYGQSVILTPQKPVAHVLFNLGAKPGHLNVNVTDRTTGSPVLNYKVLILVVGGPPLSREVEVPSQNPIAIPAEKDVLVVVQAKGYKLWFYMDGANPNPPTIRLQSGEDRNVEADIEPETKHH